MPSERSVDRQFPEDLRRQLAVQLQVDNSHLAAIPTAGLYRLREQLNVDELTGVLTRRAGTAALEEAIARVRLAGDAELAVAFLDVDSLKARIAYTQQQIAVAESQVNLQKTNLADMVVRAPFSGIAM